MKKIVFIFILSISFLNIQVFPQSFSTSALEEESLQTSEFSLTGRLRKTPKSFVILQKEGTQSLTSFKIEKKGSNKKAYKALKKLEGKIITVDCRLIKMSNPFSYTVTLISAQASD